MSASVSADLAYFPSHNAQCYAVRRVNPFRGVLQVIETESGRAISTNGVVWDIEVSAERPVSWGRRNQKTSEVAYIRYGLWSPAEGLFSRPLVPKMDKEPLALKCEQLIESIEQHIQHVPFRLRDTQELWLFDVDKVTPIALLASVIPGQRLPSPEPRYWYSCIGAPGVPSHFRFESAEALELLIKQRASFTINKYWVERREDGTGYAELVGLDLDASVFPPFLITEDWPDPGQATMVRDYIDWIAPSLLTLQGLNHEQRQRLENALHIQAVSVEQHWHLYPEVLNEKTLKAARVQGCLQRSTES